MRAASPRIIGIDEWAWRRGRRYGTMIVDLERNEIDDLLPDRDARTLAVWLTAHPAIETIARDRAEVFAEGIRAGGPHVDVARVPTGSIWIELNRAIAGGRPPPTAPHGCCNPTSIHSVKTIVGSSIG